MGSKTQAAPRTSPEPRGRRRVIGSEADAEARRQGDTHGWTGASGREKGASGGDDARASCGDDGGCEGDSAATTKGARGGRSSCPRRTRETSESPGFRGRQGRW